MTHRINIAVLWLFSSDGAKMLTGGMERWCRDVALLCRDKGAEVRIFQKAARPFEKELAAGVQVVGIEAPLTFRGNWTLSRYLGRTCGPRERLLYVSQEIALSGKLPRAMAVNHGIWWTGDVVWWKRWANKRLQYKLLRRLRGIICVDTNYINWCHAEIPHRAQWEHKLHYVPNYADTTAFKPRGTPAPGDAVRILFPRRVSGSGLERQERGAGLLLKTACLLKERNVPFRLSFAGRGNLQPAISEYARAHGFGDQVEVFEAELDGMPRVYAQADVVVIPSLGCEGTSLSAIEGMLCGKPVVVSHIGGLGNIVIDGLNGYICDLTPESLAAAILRARDDRCLERSGILDAMRECLGKRRWEEQVWSIIQTHLEL